MKIDFSGQVAVVTGGASGIGEACARVLADAGARVVVADRNEAADGRSWVRSEKEGTESNRERGRAFKILRDFQEKERDRRKDAGEEQSEAEEETADA